MWFQTLVLVEASIDSINKQKCAYVSFLLNNLSTKINSEDYNDYFI